MANNFSTSFKISILAIFVLGFVGIFTFNKLLDNEKIAAEPVQVLKPYGEIGDISWYCAEVNQLGGDFPITEEEYLVYTAYLNQNTEFKDNKEIYISDTVSRECGGTTKTYKLENKFVDLGIPVKLLSQEEIKDYNAVRTKEFDEISEAHRSGRNEEFDAKRQKSEENRKAIYTFSRVGFNEDQTKAMFEDFYQCGGPLCGAVSDAVLHKEGGLWKLVGSHVSVYY